MLLVSRRPKAIVALICVSVAIGLALEFSRDSEPRYRNIPLSQWLALHRSYEFRELSQLMVIDDFAEIPGRDTLGPEAAEAIRQIGTNALPSLVAWMNAPKRPWKIKAAAALRKLPRVIRPSKLPSWLDYSKDVQRFSLAYTGFRVLGTEAAPATPDVARIACDPLALGSLLAIDVLVQIGRPAVPELIGLLATNVAANTRRNALIGLGNIGPNAAESVPAIVACLNESDEAVACYAARALGRIRRQSEIAIPALIESLNDPRDGVKVASVRALGDYGDGAWPATTVLWDLCAQPDTQLAREAEQALLKIDATTLGGLRKTEFKPIIEFPGFP